MTTPPPYSNQVNPRKDRLPPYKASHIFANSQEELAALKEFAESKLYIQPGTNGTFSHLGGGWGVRDCAQEGATQTVSSYYDGMILARPNPEADAERKRTEEEEKATKKAERD